MPDFTPPTSQLGQGYPGININLTTFPDSTGFTLYGGQTTVTAGVIRFIQNWGSAAGTAFYNTLTTWDRNFSISWRMNVYNGGGADGWSIILSSEQGLGGGSTNCGSGQAGNVIAIRCLTWSYDRVDLVTANGLSTYASGTEFRGDQFYWLDYVHSTGLFSFYKSGTSSKPGSPLFTHTYQLPSTPCYLGFGAGSGGATDYYDLKTLAVSLPDVYASVLLNLNGDNGSTTFTDSSSNTLAVTGYGSAAISTTQSKFGSSSLYLDGNGSYLSVADNSVLDLSGDFTIEGWFYPTDFSAVNGNNRCLISFASTLIDAARPAILFNGSGALIFYNGTSLMTTAANLSLNAWSHVAFVRSGTILRAFINGNYVCHATYSTAITPDQVLIGRSLNTTGDYAGYIDDIRICRAAYYSMKGILLSTISSPAHSLTGFTGVSIVSGSDIAACTPYPVFDYTFYPASALGTSINLQAGSDIAATSPYMLTEGTGIDGTKVSLKPAGGGVTVPTTGQIYPTNQ